MKKPAFLCACLSVFLCAAVCGASNEPFKVRNEGTGKWSIPLGNSTDYSNIRVSRVIDGDTLKLENGKRVRLIGIDTPEYHASKKLYRDSQRSGKDAAAIQAMGKRSFEFIKNMVEGQYVSLAFDLERYDKYNRLLCYVYLKDGTFVNAEIVKQGYANLMTIPPNVKYAELFKKLYKEARENRRGLWK